MYICDLHPIIMKTKKIILISIISLVVTLLIVYVVWVMYFAINLFSLWPENKIDTIVVDDNDTLYVNYEWFDICVSEQSDYEDDTSLIRFKNTSVFYCSVDKKSNTLRVYIKSENCYNDSVIGEQNIIIHYLDDNHFINVFEEKFLLKKYYCKDKYKELELSPEQIIEKYNTDELLTFNEINYYTMLENFPNYMDSLLLKNDSTLYVDLSFGLKNYNLPFDSIKNVAEVYANQYNNPFAYFDLFLFSIELNDFNVLSDSELLFEYLSNYSEEELDIAIKYLEKSIEFNECEKFEFMYANLIKIIESSLKNEKFEECLIY